MRLAESTVAWCVVGLVLWTGSVRAQDAKIVSVKGTVSAAPGGKVTGVGFRAMVLKNAIRWNLAGSAQNQTTNPPTVNIVLQGDPAAIAAAQQEILKGTSKAPEKTFTIDWTDGTVDTSLTTFTVVQWNSVDRQINNHYDLVYFVNPDPKTHVIDSHGAATCYRQILFYCVTDPADRKKIDKGKGDPVGE